MRRVVMLMCAVSMASLSFGAGEILVQSFEEGVVHFGGGTIVDGPGVTDGVYSLKTTPGGGWWNSTFEFYLNEYPASYKAALAQSGQIIVDVTTNAADFVGGWAQMGILLNAGGESVSIWTPFDWQGVNVGTTHTITFQLPAEQMALLSSYNWWCNIGFLTGSEGKDAEIDPITGEVLSPAVVPTFYFDNVRIVVPEPATLALLGVGALAMRKRRIA